MNQSSNANGASVADRTNDSPRPVVSAPPVLRSAASQRPPASRRRGSEVYDALLWRLQARQGFDPAKSTAIGLIGCERRVGVTTVAANMALRASELELGPVLLVEASIDSPRLAKLWRLSPGPGLAEVLSGEACYGDCLRPGPAPDLAVIPAGALTHSAEPVVEAGNIEALLAEACADHRLVIVDLPAADQLQQMLLVAKQLDQVLLVVRADGTRQRDAEKIADRLHDDGVPLSGAILNRRRNYLPRWIARWV